ncbi:hypothetical protein [Paraburkholderia sp. J8-2]|uniref:hypothetical protein n=1 Tax=Paraburkholderia sp. J8-2 TaxID=2805440 RepID=UPI002AB6F54A|nr:hypothetical protein [Paraburkholderia sp. J8-2]
MQNDMKFSDEQISAMYAYIEARTRRYAYAKHSIVALAMCVAAVFITRSLVISPGDLAVPRWVPAACACAGVFLVVVGAGIFTQAVSFARRNLRNAGLTEELISGFDNYPVRELARKFKRSAIISEKAGGGDAAR